MPKHLPCLPARSTSASSNGWVRFAASASSWASRVDMTERPAVSAWRPAARSSFLHLRVEASDTASLREAAATDILSARPRWAQEVSAKPAADPFALLSSRRSRPRSRLEADALFRC